MKILLFGGSGLIGFRIRQLLGDKYQISAPSRSEVNVTDKIQVYKFIELLKPDYIIYSAGLTSVDEAEQNPKLAYLLNAEVPAFIAKKAESFDIPMLYFSTDAVFDGSKSSSPYLENENTNPLSEYGKSKLLGEQMVMDASSRNCIVRIIIAYSYTFTKRKRFIQIALETLKKEEKFAGVKDQIANPIYVDDVIDAVDLLIKSKSHGIYHLGARDYVTNFEFVKKLARHFNLNEKLVVGVSFEDFFKKKGAPRTKFCWLDTSKFRKKFGNNILHSIDESIELLKANFIL